MKTATDSTLENILKRPKKVRLIRARCTESLATRLHRMAAIQDKDISDLIRDAAVRLVSEFEARTGMA